MAQLFGRAWTRQALLAHVGDLSQVAGVRLAELSDGRERGVRIAEFRTGAGLDFAVLLDRGMDIGPAHYQGAALAWCSPAGFAHPAYYEPEGLGWLRTFGGGLLSGCGLTSVGSPSEDAGEQLGQHGRLSTLAASNVQVGETWTGDECCFWLSGQMRQARMFGENLRLTRRIEAWLGQNRLAVHDVVENLGDTPSPLMVLYHMNIGFPMLDETCRLLAAPHAVQPRDADAAAEADLWDRFQGPTAGYREEVFYHDLPAGPDGWSEITLDNPQLGRRLTVRAQKAGLPNFIQWKMMGRGAYVLGLEPANCWVEGRAKARADGTLQFIAPGEQREFAVEVQLAER
jgi:hypothetical protein